MKAHYSKKTFFISFLVIVAGLLAQAQHSTVYFDLDACDATIITGDNMDYSEFTPEIDNSISCAELDVLGGYLYRNNPQGNKHSCTPGVDGDPAMCIGSNPFCSFTPGADQALRIDLMVSPGTNGSTTLSELSFYEQGPTEYNWINGASGPNNYPTFFGVRILKNGVQVFLSADLPTELTWNLRTFDFSGIPEFTITEPATFNIELLPYCPVGNGAEVSAWDIDEIRIAANCCDTPEGGSLTGGPFEFCVGDGIPDNVSGIVLTGNTGSNSQWVITDDANNILNLPSSPETVNFDGGGPGNWLIWHVSYEDGLSGLEVGNDLLTDLDGCFALSNAISVIRNQPDGGTLTGGPFEFCVGDGLPDIVTGVVLSGNSGATSQWVITNDDNEILSLPASLDSVNFDGGGPGICLIWNISYFNTLTGLAVGNDLLTDVSGCYDLSNSITVVRNQPDGGELTGGPFEFCVGDSIPDYVSGVVLSGNVGTSSQWVITDNTNNILSLPASLDSVNFDGGAPGVYLIWNVSYFDTLSGLVAGNNLLSGISGCFALSNSIMVVRNQPEGGELTGGPFEFCVGDSIPDYVSGVVLQGNIGSNSQWVITNDANEILSLPSSLDAVNFDGGGPGICLIWNISYFDTLTGLVPGNNLLSDITGCFALSNSITVVRNQPEGGELSGGPFAFCVGDSIPDYVSGIVLTGNSGTSSQWVITNAANEILNLPASLDSINFDGGGPGITLIWNISYYDTLSGLVVGNNLFNDIIGCAGISNPIMVSSNQPQGGELTGGPFEFCVGDGIPDHVTGILLTGNVGSNSQWVITNEVDMIIGLPISPDSINFEGGMPGTCFIWHISYYDTLSGLVIGNTLPTDLTGCFAVSNSITVVRNQVEGGEITGGPFEFCVDDSIPDYVSGIILSGNSGNGSQWVITDDESNILFLPSSPDSVNFDLGGPGLHLIWHVSFVDSLPGLEVGNNLLTDLLGCFGLTNSIAVIRNQPEGGVLTGGPFEFCVGDSVPDYVSGIVLAGNIGNTSQWVITNEDNIILSLPSSLDSLNFDGGGPGNYLIWNISYYESLAGLVVGNDLLSDIAGCFDLSNAIMVITNQIDGGELTGGPFAFCVGDGIPDHVSGITISGNGGTGAAWVITDEFNNILYLPSSPDSVNFDLGGPGLHLIWHISFVDSLPGLEVGNNLFTDLMGCFGLSNAITVIRNQPEGGELTGGPFEFCVGDNIPDYLSGIFLTGNIGDTSQWVITDDINIILSIHSSLDSINFDGGSQGVLLIWNISYYDTLSGLLEENDLLADVMGCFGLSNPIMVILNQPEGGELSGGPFEFCVGDTIPDHVSGLVLLGNIGANSQYVVTDSAFTIQHLPGSPEEVDFNQSAPGTCLIWHVSYDGTLTGLAVDSNLMEDLEGCFSISNSITVTKITCVGLQDDGPILSMSMSPNPVQEVMTLQVQYKGEDIPLVRLFDASGRLCYKQYYNPESDMTIDMSYLADGCYFLHVQTAAGYKAESVLVVR